MSASHERLNEFSVTAEKPGGEKPISGHLHLTPAIEPPLWLLRIGLWLLFPVAIPVEAIFGGMVVGPAASMMTCFLVGYLVSLCLGVVITAGRYCGTTFTMTSSSVSSELDFVFKKRKDLLFSNIKEIELKMSIFQRMFGLGTIILHTQASLAGHSKTGLSLFDLENAEEVYILLKEKIAQVG